MLRVEAGSFVCVEIDAGRTRTSACSAPPHLRVSVLTCTGRHPSSLGLFSDQVLRAQNTESVVLELWADMLAMGSATRLSFSYVLVPVLVSSHNEGGRFSHTNLVTPQNPDEVLALLRRKKTIEAYYDIAIGAKLFAENQWSLAPTYLCKGAALMQNSPDDADLVKYSRALAIDAAQKAASSQNGDNIYQLRGGTPIRARPQGDEIVSIGYCCRWHYPAVHIRSLLRRRV